jgi:hypothetical protein
LCTSFEELLSWADQIIVTQKPSEEIVRLLVAHGTVIVDIAGVINDSGRQQPDAQLQSRQKTVELV